jgi:cytochrome aa3-600 menaquinol oxidase subunit 4
VYNTSKRYPIGQLIGFVMSLVLTFGAAWITLKTNLSFQTVMWTIGTLAVIQAAIQLFMFMHVNEGDDRKTQVINIIYGTFIAVVVGSFLWATLFLKLHNPIKKSSQFDQILCLYLIIPIKEHIKNHNEEDFYE